MRTSKQCFKNRIYIYRNIKTWYIKFYLSKLDLKIEKKPKNGH